MAYVRKNSKPSDMRIALLHWQGFTQEEVADMMGVTSQTVHNVLQCPAMQAFFEDVRAGVLDTMLDVQTTAQAIAPRIMQEKISLALDCPDARVRSTNCKDLLEMAGHKPPEHIEVVRSDKVSEKYGKKTEKEIREEILRGLMPSFQTEDSTTLH
jgi:hypothetical protein